MVEKILIRALVLALIIGLVLGLEELHRLYFIPSVIEEATEKSATPPGVIVKLPLGKNEIDQAFPVDMSGALVMNCSCIKEPPQDIFVRNGWRYTCAKTQVDFLRSLRCFECIAANTRCPWDNQGLVMFGG